MNDLEKAIEIYQNGLSIGLDTILIVVSKQMNNEALKNPSLLHLINYADLIVERLESEAISEMDSVKETIFHCLYDHVLMKWVTRRFNSSYIQQQFHHLISIRQVTSYVESHQNRYKIREKEYKILHHNYYVIENKIHSGLQLRYSRKICNRISNSLMVVMYYLKLISKYHCKMKYDLIQSVVKDFGTKELY